MTNITIETSVGELELLERLAPLRLRFVQPQPDMRRLLVYPRAVRRVQTNASVNIKAEALKKRTFAFALAIIAFCRVLRKTWEGHELSDQLLRCETRVGANYRAACRARSHVDFVNKMGVVVEEADEAVYWLELLRASGSAQHTIDPVAPYQGWRVVRDFHAVSYHREVQCGPLPLA